MPRQNDIERKRNSMKPTPYRDRSRAELLAEKEQVQAQFEALKGRGLKLDMSRGKPGKAQLDLVSDLLTVLPSIIALTASMASISVTLHYEDGLDAVGPHGPPLGLDLLLAHT